MFYIRLQSNQWEQSLWPKDFKPDIINICASFMKTVFNKHKWTMFIFWLLLLTGLIMAEIFTQRFTERWDTQSNILMDKRITDEKLWRKNIYSNIYWKIKRA